MSQQGVSRKVNIIGPSKGLRALGTKRKKETFGLQKIAEERKRVKEEYQNLVHGKDFNAWTKPGMLLMMILLGLSKKSRRILTAMRSDPAEVDPDRTDEVVTIMGHDPSVEDDPSWQTVSDTPGPHGVSNEEAVASALRDMLDVRYVPTLPI